MREDKYQKSKRMSEVNYKRAAVATCPNCKRMNAYFKTHDNERNFSDVLVLLAKCRYCGYARYFSPTEKKFYVVIPPSEDLIEDPI